MKASCFFISLVLWQCASAQWFNNSFSYTTQNGLSNNTITCLQKDSAGFLWIGTHEGLNRYDGTEFINVLSNSKNNLPSNNITKIAFINRTLVAIGTDAGLCLLNSTTLLGKKINLPFIQQFAFTGLYIADILYQQQTGELWIATWHGLFVLDKQGKLLRKMMTAESTVSKGLFARHLFRYDGKNVFFYSQEKKCFCCADFSNNKSVPVEQNWPTCTLNDLLKNNYVLMGAQMLNNEITCIFSKQELTGRDEQIAYYNISTGKHFTHRINAEGTSEKRLSNAIPVNDSIFIVNSFFGEPLLYNSNSQIIRRASSMPLWFTSWPDGLGACIYRDESNIWVGTSRKLLQFPIKTNVFATNPILINRLRENQSLVSFNYGLYHDNKLWVTAMGAGLFTIDTASNRIDSFFSSKTPAEFRRKIISTETHAVGKSLWLFSMYGPAEIDPISKSIKLVEAANKDSSFDQSGFFPLQDSKKNIWVSLPDGVAKYTAATGIFINYKSKYSNGPLPVLKVGSKTEDTAGNIWMARGDTLIKFNSSNQQFTIVSTNGIRSKIRAINNLASGGGNILYISTGQSFGIYDVSTGHLDLFSKQTGIISTAINDMVSDKEGNAWIATEGGLVFYNKQKKKFSSFTQADGLPEDNVSSINFTDSTKKTLFLGFSKAYCLFKPAFLLLDADVPQNIITGVEAAGETFNINEQQTLSYKQNNVFFSYTGINYNQGQQNNYACMLEGFDQDWKYTGTERKVNYINLPPDKYVFKVKSANHQGEWNEQPAIFEFEIKPPFWQQWWFRGLLGCAIILTIYYFIKKREYNFQKENSLKLQLSELRMQALRAQMNPHFIFNSLNSIQNYILSNNTIDAAGYLSKFAKLMRRILDQSKHNFLPLGDVMETLQLYVEIEAFRFNHEFSYSFDIEQNDELLDTDMPPMLLQPFVENAIIHGLMPKKGEKKLMITCRLVNNQAEITIDDNGLGRSANLSKAGHDSQGGKLTAGMLESLQQLKNNKAHIEIIDKTDNETPAGTTVILVLPLN